MLSNAERSEEWEGGVLPLGIFSAVYKTKNKGRYKKPPLVVEIRSDTK